MIDCQKDYYCILLDGQCIYKLDVCRMECFRVYPQGNEPELKEEPDATIRVSQETSS